jgi:hypothetical protein
MSIDIDDPDELAERLRRTWWGEHGPRIAVSAIRARDRQLHAALREALDGDVPDGGLDPLLRVRAVVELLAPVRDTGPPPEEETAQTCPSRHYAYECARPMGHVGEHATEGCFTIWTDAADTRLTLTGPATTRADVAPDRCGVPGCVRVGIHSVHWTVSAKGGDHG